MKIFILEDDEERIKLFEQYGIGQDLTIARTYEEAITKFAPPYALICLDHDLGGNVYVQSEGEEKTGYHFVQWMLANYQQETLATRAIVHSYNPDGANKMCHEINKSGGSAIKIPFGINVLQYLKK